MAAEYELTLNDYISILKRRMLLIISIFTLIWLASIALAILLPPIYQSTGTILVESQQIPTDLVKSNVTDVADERIELIKQRVMTRDNLYKIMQKYGLYEDVKDKKSTSVLIDEMKESIGIKLLSSNNGNAYEKKNTIAFDVSFDYKKPEIAHKVANELVTLFLDENVKARTEKATETTEFLSQEVETLRKELENTETKVANFKEQFAGALPEHMDMYMTMVERTESEIKEVTRDYKSTQEELRFLDVELASAKSGINKKVEMQAQVPTVDMEIDKTKLELERALSLYSDSHPTVKALKRKLETLEKSASGKASDGSAKPKKDDVEVDLMVAKVDAQIEAAKSRLSSLTEQKESLRKKIDVLQAKISRSPEVERGLFSLMRDYDNAKSKYEEVKSKQINARIAENLEQENKAERFSMLEPPSFPEKPIKPDRKKIVGFGFFGALVSALLATLLLETVNARVRGSDALASITRVRTMATIPYIYTQAEIRRKKYFYRNIIIGILAFVFVSLIIIHFLVMPLDLVMAKVFNRLT